MTQAKRRVLLVDDEPGILKTVGKRLEVSGYEVLTAADGQDGLSKARLGHPDVIILDLMMPRMNGFEVCAALKRDPQCRQIPVIILPGRGRGWTRNSAGKSAPTPIFRNRTAPKRCSSRLKCCSRTCSRASCRIRPFPPPIAWPHSALLHPSH